MSKLTELENFLLNENSNERKIYEDNILSGKSRRPEEEFITRHLGRDFWKELGYDDSELGFQEKAGDRGFVEIALTVDGKKIAVECKKPFDKMKDQIMVRHLKGEDPDEIKDQIKPYLANFDYVIFTNGFFWYFYSKTSCYMWETIKDNKKEIKPYFHFLKAEQIFKNDANYIENFLSRQNITQELYAIEQKSPRHVITDVFFEDLRTWIDVIDESLKNSPVDTKARTTSLINKMIFVRTMEGFGVIPNGFLASIWNEKKGIVKSTVKFIDRIDDELTDTFNTELFTSLYLETEDGQPVIKNGAMQHNTLRQKNYAYSNIPEQFFSAILKQRDDVNARDTGFTRISINDKHFSVKSLYWWKFEAIPADILGKAYETYLARKRKKLGIYYTPHQMTEYLTRKTVSFIFDGKISQLKSELEKKDWNTERIEEIANNIAEIKICDPSCGSGSFLIQAMRIVWKKYQELAKLITEYSEKFRSTREVLDKHFSKNVGVLTYLEVLFRIKSGRERLGTIVLRHIHGNDKDINAIDTAKLNIWLECLRLEPNAFRLENLEGKRHVLPNLELNLTIGDSLMGLDNEDIEKELSGQKGAIKSIFDMRRIYSEKFESTSIAQDAVRIRNSLGDFLDLELSNRLDGEEMKELETKFGKTSIELIKILQPTHWALQHVSAFFNANGDLKNESGFDVIIGNPPWEILEPNIDEFYGPFYNSDDMAKFSLLKKDEKNEAIKKLSKDQLVDAKWKYYNNEIELQLEYYRKTKTYQYQTAKTHAPQNKIRPNFYKLFIEKYHSLLKNGGVAGLVLPSNIYTDQGTKGLRQLLFDDCEIHTLYGFDNKNGIFEEIHRQLKFVNLIFKKGGKTSTFDSAFCIRDVNEIRTLDDHAMRYDIDLVKKASPDSLTISEYKNQKEVDIVKKLLKFPLLSEGKPLLDDTVELSNWKIRFQREFNNTDDAPLFNTKGVGYTVCEGKTIHQFSNTYAKPRYWAETTKGKKFLENTQIRRINKKYKTAINQSSTKLDCESFRLVWRDITSTTNTRTIISTIMPPEVFLVETLPYLRPNYFNGKEFQEAVPLSVTAFMCGLFNSFVIDFIIRQRISLHATMSHILELPIPRYSEKDPYFSEIVQNVGSLICTSPEFDSLKKELQIKKGVTDLQERERLMAQISAYTAKIYDLTKEELEYILSTFSEKNQPLKQRVLEEFNKL